jgi:hypothetical protein
MAPGIPRRSVKLSGIIALVRPRPFPGSDGGVFSLSELREEEARSGGFLAGYRPSFLAQALAGDNEAMSVMNNAIQNDAGVGGVFNEAMPFVCGELTGDNC